MKRKIGFAALTIALTASLAACGGTGSATPDPDQSPAVTPNVVARGNVDSGTRSADDNGDYTAYGARNGLSEGMNNVAQGVGDVGRGVVNGAGDLVQGVGNGIQSVGQGMQNAAR